jgi:hypothetical protein
MRAHTLAGDHVEIRDWSPTLLHERSWGRIYVGLASPAWIGSDRAYGAMLTINALWSSKPDQQDPRLRLFIDDPNLRVLVNGISSLAASPSRFFTPANNKRRGWSIVSRQPDLQARIARTLNDLNGWDVPWPTTYLPAFRWADSVALATPLRTMQKASIITVDPSPALPVGAICAAARTQKVRDSLIPTGDFWIAEGSPDNRWISEVVVSKPIVTIRPTTDAARVAYYRRAFGVLEPILAGTTPGWWSSRMQLAAATYRYYATDWRLLRDQMPLSEPYIHSLPAGYEDLDSLSRDRLVAAQAVALKETTGTLEEMWKDLDVNA